MSGSRRAQVLLRLPDAVEREKMNLPETVKHNQLFPVGINGEIVNQPVATGRDFVLEIAVAVEPVNHVAAQDKHVIACTNYFFRLADAANGIRFQRYGGDSVGN
jgi:hypothetical protein